MLSKRFEFKFLIDAKQKKRVLDSVRHALREDPNGQSAVYRVSSQYFDTKGLSAYWEKLDGEAVRKKFRLRYYSIDGDGNPRVKNAFMEIKHRVNQGVYKERVRLTDEGAETILSNGKSLQSIDEYVQENNGQDLATINEVKRAASQPGFSAIHVITYLREAWLGRVDRRFRLTFDSACQVLNPTEFLAVESSLGQGIASNGTIVMEIKFDHSVPRWMRSVAATEGLQLRRFSKYATGVDVAYPDVNKTKSEP